MVMVNVGDSVCALLAREIKWAIALSKAIEQREVKGRPSYIDSWTIEDGKGVVVYIKRKES